MTERTYAGYSADALRELAASATPGPWRNHTIMLESRISRIEDYTTVVGSFGLSAYGQDRTNARYIAAVSPATMLALLDAIARLEAEGARLRGALVSFFNTMEEVRSEDTFAGGIVRGAALRQLRAALEEARDGE